MDNIKVSIIMPSLNVAKYISECLESVVNQTLKDIEIICIDAGSTDGTEEIIKEYVSKDNRVIFVHSDIKSYGYQVNRGIDMAQGEYVAIMETDDFAVLDMYEYLYNLAKENDTEITKADYDRVTKMKNGEYIQIRNKIIARGTDIYYQVVEPRKVDWLFCEDYFLWKGIYLREFLNANEIRLNETPGAAFQDMGFMNQVLSYAKRAIYSDRSLYRYRVDREECSTYSPKILGYGVQEFKWLLDKIEQGKPLYEKGMYIHMMHSFRGELGAVMKNKDVNLDFESPYVAEAYEWYMSHLTLALEEGIINIDDDTYGCESSKMQKAFKGKAVLLEDIKDEISREEIKKQRIAKLAEDNQQVGIVIVGAGIRGESYLLQLADVTEVKAFADNAANDAPYEKFGFSVLGPKECIKRYPNATYIIANKFHSDELLQQLLSEGIKEEKIVVNPLSEVETDNR